MFHAVLACVCNHTRFFRLLIGWKFKLVFDGSNVVLERSSIEHSSGQFLCSFQGIFGIRLLPPFSLGGFRLTEYGCGVRLPTSVRPRRALSEALGLPMAS